VNLAWLPYLIAMRGPVLELLRELYKLTQGDPHASTLALRRMRDRGFVLKEVEAEVDARLDAVERRRKDKP
jgi:hypothetical protein